MESDNSALNGRSGLYQDRFLDRMERLLAPVDRFFNLIYSSKYNPIYQSGTLVIGLFFIMLLTGIYLVFIYRTAAPYESISWMNDQVWHGRWIRSLHRYTADAAMVSVFFHMLRMLLQGRNWGSRLLSWITGLVLVGAVLLCGWTGLVMAWDTQSFLVASEGAKLLDTLPLFSEPISRTFIKEDSLQSMFFFFNLVGHMALPVALAFLLWLHTFRVTRPVVLPQKKLLLGVFLTLLAVSVIWPLQLQPEADIQKISGETNLDLFFTFWVPVSRAVSPLTHLMIWVGVGALMISIPFWWRPRRALKEQISRLNEEYCTGCKQCSLDCPSDAITMSFIGPNSDEKPVAIVSASLCVSCGICAGSCAPMQIGPPGRDGKDQLRDVEEFLVSKGLGGKDIALFVCNQGIGMRKKIEKMQGVHLYPVHCAGGIHTSVIELLLRKGVGGVQVLACAGRNCLYREGPKWLHERIYNDREAELKGRVDKRRVNIGNFDYPELKPAIAAIEKFRAFVDTLPVEKAVENSIPAQQQQEQELTESGHG